MQLLHIKFGGLAHAGPKDRASFVVDFQHVSFGFFARVTKDALEDHCDVAHQIYRVIVDDDVPGNLQFLLGTRFFFDGGRASG